MTEEKLFGKGNIYEIQVLDMDEEAETLTER